MNALIGPSCSGKSALALNLARQFKLDIFSIDSLSVYKYIDIASAKPSKIDLNEIKHFGINLLEPHEKCNVQIFFNLLENLQNKKNLLIVGGSSFYLKSMIDGLSVLPPKTKILEEEIERICLKIPLAYDLLKRIDKEYASKINPNDKYRIQKALEIFLLTNTPPSIYFKNASKRKFSFKINIFEILKPRSELAIDIAKRTKTMFDMGLIDEVQYLKDNYSNIQAFKAIGIKEVLLYLNGEIKKEEALNLIIKNTLSLAKRQITFNRTQFKNVQRGSKEEVEAALMHSYESSIV